MTFEDFIVQYPDNDTVGRTKVILTEGLPDTYDVDALRIDVVGECVSAGR